MEAGPVTYCDHSRRMVLIIDSHIPAVTRTDDHNMDVMQSIIERVMTLHWDMAACRCWVCVAGRSVGCRPQPQYLQSRDEIRDGLVSGK
jgi:hypothetical protein